MTSIKDRLAAAKLPERSVQVCLRGDLAADFDILERKLREAKGGDSPTKQRLGVKSEARDIAEQMEALREQMASETLDIRVRALARPDWRALTKEHPPLDDSDKSLGFDFEGLMGAAIPQCIIEPEMDADDIERLFSVLSDADYERLLEAVWLVNRSGVDVPKSRLASLVMAESDDDSK